MIHDVEPAQEGMDQRPKNTVIHLPAQQGSQNGTDTPEHTTAETSTTGLFLITHFGSTLPQENIVQGGGIFDFADKFPSFKVRVDHSYRRADRGLIFVARRAGR